MAAGASAARAAPRATGGVDWFGVGLSLRPGTLIGERYRLLEPLGRGGMGSVWAATHLLTEREVAMKFVRGPAHARRERRERFLREARAATAVRHPNVIHVLDAFALDDETHVMVMDRLRGETLRARLERHERLSLTETVRLVSPVVSAVRAAHACGIVHRDLKPENIFLASGEDGQVEVKVLDFGIAKLCAPDAEPSGLITQAGATLGTPCYMAPEQATADKDLDQRVDVWALGVILYECLAGLRPIEGESVGQVVMRLMSTGIIPLERVAFGLPEEVTALVGRMLARERAKRPSDLGEVLEVLQRYGGSELPAGSAPARAAPRRARVGMFVATGALAVGLGIWLVQRSAAEPGRRTETSPPASTPSLASGALSAAPAPAPEGESSAAAPPPLVSASARRPSPAAPRARPAPTPSSSAAPAVSLQGLAETPPF